MKIALISDKIIDIKRNNVDYFCSEDKIPSTEWSNYDIAVLLEPYTKEALIRWTGHPHLRCCDTVDEVEKELFQLENNIEIERKYLVEFPDIEALNIYNPYNCRIEQVYLNFDLGTRRIRKRSSEGVTLYYETVKMRISDTSSHEYEHIITQSEYNELLKTADNSKRAIKKNRYCFVYNKQYFELDVFDFWKDKAVLEIELCDEKESVDIPLEIKVIKDVSEDYNYKNSQLARIDYEDC